MKKEKRLLKRKNGSVILIILMLLSLISMTFAAPVGDIGQPAVKSSFIEWDGVDMTMKYDIVNDTANMTVVADAAGRGCSWEHDTGSEWASAVGGCSITKSPINNTYYVAGRDRPNDGDRGYQWVVMKANGDTLNSWTVLWRQIRSNVINSPTPAALKSIEGVCIRYYNSSYYFYFCVMFTDVVNCWSVYYIKASSVEALNATLHDGNNWNLINKEGSLKVKDPMVFYNGSKYYLIWTDSSNSRIRVYSSVHPEFGVKTQVYSRLWAYTGEHSGVILFDNKTANQFILWTDEVDKDNDRVGFNFYNSTDTENWTFSDTHFKNDRGMVESKNMRYFDYYSEGWNDYVVIMEFDEDDDEWSAECCLWDYRVGGGIPSPPASSFEENFEDDTPGQNPSETWYTFTELEGPNNGHVVNENNATWTHTFKVDTGAANDLVYTGVMNFTSGAYARFTLNWRVDTTGSNYHSNIYLQNGSTRIAGVCNEGGNNLKVFSDGAKQTVTGFSFQSDTWYYIIIDFNWTDGTYHLMVDYADYGWYAFYESEENFDRIYFAESSGIKKGTFWTDNIQFLNVSVNVRTNESTGVEETNATMHGYLESTLSGTYTVRFQYGTTTSYGSTTTNQNKNAGDEFNIDQTGLSPGTTYHYRAYAANGTAELYGFDRTFTTKPNPPSNFYVNTTDGTTISLNWTKGTGATNTVVSRNASGAAAPPAAPDDGTIIYNSTGTMYTDTSRIPCVNYSYAIWSWTASYSDNNQTGYNITLPGIPTGITGDVLDGTTNISWTKGTNTDNTLIRKKLGSYPTGVTDGTLLYNNTGTYSIEAVAYNEFVSLWGYNSTYNLYSLQVDMVEGGLKVNCFDENTTAPLTFDIFMTNLPGTQTYNASGCTNTYTVDITVAPNGDDILVYINSSGYVGRQYYADMYVGFWYFIDAYLTDESELYVLSVIDELDNPVEEAEIQIKRYINETEGYKNITVVLTDGNGYSPVHLIPGQLYKVVITKTGYDIEISDYIPSTTTYAHTFRLKLTTPTQPTIYHFWDEIDFTATAYRNGSVNIQYDDSSELSDDTQFYLYESYDFTDTLADTETKINEDVISYWVTGLNVTRLHFVNLYFNHSYTFYEEQPIRILIYPVNKTANITQQSFDEYLNEVVGVNELGWGNCIACALAVILLCSFSPFNAGIGIISAGVSLAAVETVFYFSNLVIVAIIPIVIFIGIFYILATRQPEAHI